MNTTLLDLISDAADAAKAGGMDRAIALDFAAQAIQQSDETLSWLVALRIADSLLPNSEPGQVAA
ncbi:hypothetical protein A6A04_09090 [Paramagnetospirillum marisnigri]|uniref:Uncharacterized protein n=1 Tax=Paramagnetospirillum marisnigri TaxID=1285242 RepID=A0A178M7K5_9PROT|nr:hypothetical protein [Paramagnetospirillum marisnigri]OAN44025.1 hypothetical protein A6A04_09090 [Paramagnetospirillum marisnigri]